MRLKGSYTVENAVIIPMFTIIIVALAALDFYMHDTVISKCTMLQMAVRLEFETEEAEGWNSRDAGLRESLRQRGSEYLKTKSIARTDSEVLIEDEKRYVQASCSGCTSGILAGLQTEGAMQIKSRVDKNSPDEFIRLISAIRNAGG